MRGTEHLDVRDVAGGAAIAVKAVPGASRDRVAGVLGDCLKVVTSAPAEKGRANRAIAGILAGALGVGRRAVALTAGAASPRKQFRVAGLNAAEVRRRLDRLP